tara:strand:+ start:198 stop:677 length:480 start_codon:yes stop_codon:yes gene_type:complete
MTNNILEKDIEAAIHDGQLLMKYGVRIVGRQLKGITKECADSNKYYQSDFGGIVDLIGYHLKSRTWIIIEIKRGVLDASAFTQLSRYIKHAEYIADEFYCDRRGRRPKIAGLLIGTDWTKEVDFINDFEDIKDGGSEFFFYQPITMLTFTAKSTLEVNI